MENIKKNMEKQQTTSENIDTNEIDAHILFNALNELEEMIENEKKGRRIAEKRINEIQKEPVDAIDDPMSLSPLRKKIQRNEYKPIEEIAEEVIDLIQKRNELSDKDDMFGKLTKTTFLTNEYKNMVNFQMNISRKSNDLIRKGSKSAARLGISSSLQDAMRRLETRKDSHNIKDSGYQFRFGGDDESEDKKEKENTVIVKHEPLKGFFERAAMYEGVKQKNLDYMRNENEMNLHNERLDWFKPKINTNSEMIVTQKRMKDKTPRLDKRLDKVISDREKSRQEVKKKYEEKENNHIANNCTFQPKISSRNPSLIKGQEKGSRSNIADGISPLPHASRDNFLQRLDDYDKKRKTHLSLLQRKKFEEELDSLKDKPTICKQSKKIVGNRKSTIPIDERLYKEAVLKEKRIDSTRRAIKKEVYPFKPIINKRTALSKKDDDNKLSVLNALQNLEMMLTTQNEPEVTGERSFQDISMMDKSATSATIKPILKTPAKFTPERNDQPKDGRGKTPITQKKVYFMNDKQKRGGRDESFVDEDGYVNIVLDKMSIKELLKALK